MDRSARVLTLGAALAALALPALAAPAVAEPAAPAPSADDRRGHTTAYDLPEVVLWATGTPTAAGDGGAFVYDDALVPASAVFDLGSVSVEGRTDTVFSVLGLLPDRTYGAHLHAKECGTDPAASGPHYRHADGDPKDPAVVNAANEVWLDLTTDATGAGVAVASNPWTYRAHPGSVVLHANPTSTEPATPGDAGPRVACMNLVAG